MTGPNSVFVLGAGFSKPAGMPLATELIPLLVEQLQLEEMRAWLTDLGERLAYLCADEKGGDSFPLNIEQVFHYARFDIEAYRLKQQLAPVGRGDGPGTPWAHGESVEAWLQYLEDALRDVIIEQDNAANLAPITRWAQAVGEDDAVLTFNYDTLAERALRESGKPWTHGLPSDPNSGIPVFKLHGSIDWIVAHRSESFSELDLVFDKQNTNRSQRNTGYDEDDYRLWRCRYRSQLTEWLAGRQLQQVSPGASPRSVGIAGLGAYKEPHRVPGLGPAWVRGMHALRQSRLAVVVGFSMSDFDVLAQMWFAAAARARQRAGETLRVIIIDPVANEAHQARFRRVFRSAEFRTEKHEAVDWSSLA